MGTEEVIASEVPAEGAGVEAAASVPTEDAAVGTEETPEATATPELYQVRVNGRVKEVPLEDLIANYSKGEDYTRKTQELAQQREAVQQMFALQAALERDPRTTLATLAGALGVDLGTAQAMVTQAQQGEEDPFAVLTQKVDSLASTLTAQQQAALAAQQQQAQQAALQAQIEREIADLKDLHGDFDQQELVRFAVENGVPNLGVAFRAWQFEKAEQQKLAEANRAVEAKRKAQVVSGGRTTSPSGAVVPGSGANGHMSVREAFAAALAAAQ